MRDKKFKHKDVHPSPPSALQLAIDELQLYTNAQDAEFMNDSIMSYCISSEQFAELDDIARSDHFRFHTLVRNLIRASYHKPHNGKSKVKRKK